MKQLMMKFRGEKIRTWKASQAGRRVGLVIWMTMQMDAKGIDWLHGQKMSYREQLFWRCLDSQQFLFMYVWRCYWGQCGSNGHYSIRRGKCWRERVAERVCTSENAFLKYLGCNHQNYPLEICKCDLKTFSQVYVSELFSLQPTPTNFRNHTF